MIKHIQWVQIVTNTKDKNASWETSSSLAIREIFRFLRNPIIHYCIQNRPPLVPILRQMNPVHAFPSIF
jgi:hypothetical protein